MPPPTYIRPRRYSHVENLNPLLNYLLETITNPVVLLFGTITIFEVSPIKINPWKWIGRIINSEMLQQMEEVKNDIATIKKDKAEDNAENMRSQILSFAASCRRHEHHDAEEWNHIIAIIKKYETYVEERGIDNGVIEETAAFLRELYHKRLVNNDFD